MMPPDARILVAGAEDLLGAAIVRALRRGGHEGVVTDYGVDVTDARAVDALFERHRFTHVFHAAGRSGGISMNQRHPATLMLHNLLATTNLVASAHRHEVTKLLYLASSCSYPRQAPQPMRVESLFGGPLEPTNAAYATAKLAGIELCRAYRAEHGDRFVTAIPANAFGPGDDFSPDDGHVIAALLRRAHEAKARGDRQLVVWGTGRAVREFVFADDVGDACVFLVNAYDAAAPINIGGPSSVTIGELARMVVEVVGFEGELVFDPSKPDGMPEKRLDSSPLRSLGFEPATPLREALSLTYRWYRETHAEHT